MLDPFQTPSMIANALGISLRTYYRYESELALPTMRVAIGSPSNLPRAAALKKMMDENEFDLKMTLELARDAGARLEIVPCEFSIEPERLLRQRKVDLALAHRSWTPDRAREFYGSDHYQGPVRPSGRLFVRRGAEIQSFGSQKPLLGMQKASVHSDYARDHLQRDFDLRPFGNIPSGFASLASGALDAVLTHPSVPGFFGIDLSEFEMRGTSFDYGTHSVILFHADSVHWRERVNETIARVESALYLNNSWDRLRS